MAHTEFGSTVCNHEILETPYISVNKRQEKNISYIHTMEIYVAVTKNKKKEALYTVILKDHETLFSDKCKVSEYTVCCCLFTGCVYEIPCICIEKNLCMRISESRGKLGVAEGSGRREISIGNLFNTFKILYNTNISS